MIGFTPKPINLDYSSIPLEKISEFDKNSGYVQGATRRYGNNIYIALGDINPTVHHIWNDTDPLNIYGYDLYTDAKIPDPTNVYIVNGVTVVYVLSNKHYYKAKHTGYVDYTLENPVTPTYFDDLGTNPTPLYRRKLDYPNGKKDTLLWGYKGILNRYIMLDEIINKQTVNNRTFTTNLEVVFSTNTCLLSEPLSDNIYVEDKIKIAGTQYNNDYFKITSIATNRLSFEIETTFTNETVAGSVTFFTQTYIKFKSLGIDRIAFFNIISSKIEIKIFNGATTTIKEIEMLDSSWINTFELFCFNEPTRLYNTAEELLPTYTQQFEITFFGDSQQIGEVMIGTASDLGLVEDSVTIDGRIYTNLEEASNGDIYVEQDLTQEDILDRKQFTMIVDTNRVEYFKNNIKALLGKPIVISGSNIDNDNISSLLTYGFIRDYSFKAKFKDEKSTYNFEIREFKEWQS